MYSEQNLTITDVLIYGGNNNLKNVQFLPWVLLKNSFRAIKNWFVSICYSCKRPILKKITLRFNISCNTFHIFSVKKPDIMYI